jgi:hypothetical protein
MYGTLTDPIRPTDLNELASAYSCPKRFAFKKEEQARGAPLERRRVRSATCVRAGVHEAIRTYLTPGTEACARVLAGERPRFEAMLSFVEQKIEQAAGGVPIDWKAARGAALNEATHMTLGALRTVAERAAEIVLVEAPFLVEIDTGQAKSYWLQGTADLVYRPKGAPSEVALAVWKTSPQRPSEILLDHGYLLGIHAQALGAGVFFPGTSGELALRRHPRELHVVHLRDFIPYAKKGSKVPTHRDELAYFGVASGTKVAYEPGQERGPGWHRTRRSELDVQRLKSSLRTIVSTVRLGRFVEHLCADCAQCTFKHACLVEGRARAAGSAPDSRRGQRRERRAPRRRSPAVAKSPRSSAPSEEPP